MDTIELVKKLRDAGWGTQEEGFQWVEAGNPPELLPCPSKAELVRELDKLTDFSKGRPIEEIPFAYEEQMALWLSLKAAEVK